jgi:hypothetical protein
VPKSLRLGVMEGPLSAKKAMVECRGSVASHFRFRCSNLSQEDISYWFSCVFPQAPKMLKINIKLSDH